MKGENFAGNPMADLSNWAFPPEMQPNPEESRFDLEAALDSMVLLRSEVPEDAFTAGILGTERIGNGVVIRDDGLVLTIGYLITEATTIWLNTNKGAAFAGHCSFLSHRRRCRRGRSRRPQACAQGQAHRQAGVCRILGVRAG